MLNHEDGSWPDSTQWRAFVRDALRAHGYTVDSQRLAAFTEELRTDGVRLLDELDVAVRDCGAEDGLAPLRTDPYLWPRLSGFTAYGAAQCRALESAIHGHRPGAVPLATAVATSMRTVDHLATTGLAEQVADAVEPELLGLVFADEYRARQAVHDLAPKVPDARVGVVVGLLGVVATLGARLLRTGGRPETWRRLGELATVQLGRSTVEPRATGPVRVTALCATLAAQAHGITPALVDVRPLGHLYGCVEELVELPGARCRPYPNRYVNALTDRAAARGAHEATPLDAFVVGEEGAAVVAALVEELAPGPFGEHAALVVGAYTG